MLWLLLGGLMLAVLGSMPVWPHSKGWSWQITAMLAIIWVSALLVGLAIGGS